MGTVYRGHDRELDRAVAIKVLSPTASSAEALERMRQETRILARLEHPGVVPIYDVGRLEDDRLFYVMKLVRGQRLDEHMVDRTLSERLRLFVRICDPVAFAHARGIVHRDLKPENVMVGEFGEVLVMDWGVAAGHIDSASGVGSGTIVGTRAYMAPEQARGRQCRRPRRRVLARSGSRLSLGGRAGRERDDSSFAGARGDCPQGPGGRSRERAIPTSSRSPLTSIDISKAIRSARTRRRRSIASRAFHVSTGRPSSSSPLI